MLIFLSNYKIVYQRNVVESGDGVKRNSQKKEANI